MVEMNDERYNFKKDEPHPHFSISPALVKAPAMSGFESYMNQLHKKAPPMKGGAFCVGWPVGFEKYRNLGMSS